jgi:hypothetical protein
VWDRFYAWGPIWKRSACCPNITSRIAFMFLSKLYRQMYAGTGISTDSARRRKSQAGARWTARQCKRLFKARPMPELLSPKREIGMPDLGQAVADSGNGGAMAAPFAISRK